MAEPTPAQRFAAYLFDSDADYQQGLQGIVAGGALEGRSEEEKRELLLRSEVFYFNHKTGLTVDLDEARAARNGSSNVDAPVTTSVHPPASDVATDAEPPTLTFAQLKALIEQGKTDEIPNNKTIPNVLSTDAPSESRAAIRKKPWEVDAAA
ncbi:uncharacterized protein BXZ73DRAFT_89252 [Epithele typhae]|uniref:uncharacterized protein n=1 Tax=Epithele typhae TaxID=378194 RepID=UPI002007DAEF|nr:uncharacterized protein BXZ73DRAFT_89252 [Epithele typhae]KAH9937833.1 hypothetical protein BXZ73DRAFT_89252 [Epithele typhae]